MGLSYLLVIPQDTVCTLSGYGAIAEATKLPHPLPSLSPSSQRGLWDRLARRSHAQALENTGNHRQSPRWE